MIAIQLSRNIIKRNNALLKESATVIDTNLNYRIENYKLENYGRGYSQEKLEDETKREQKKNREKNEALRLANKEREKIISLAQKEAEKIKADASQEGYQEGLDKGQEDGFNQGLEKGQAEGTKKGYLQGISQSKQEADEIKEKAFKMLKDAQKEVEQYYEDNQDNIINLAVQMAESIIHTTIDTSDDNLLPMIKPIVQHFKNVGNVIITCHPDNFEFLKKNIYRIEDKYKNIRFIILEDENLEENGCIIENDNQVIDLQIKKQIENILEKLDNLE